MKLKKLVVLSLVVLYIISAVGCSDKEKEETEAEKTQRLLNER